MRYLQHVGANWGFKGHGISSRGCGVWQEAGLRTGMGRRGLLEEEKEATHKCTIRKVRRECFRKKAWVNCVKHCWRESSNSDKMTNQTWLLSSFRQINPGETTEAIGCTDKSISNIKTEKVSGKPKAVMNQQGQVQSGAMREEVEGKLLNSALVSTQHCHARSQKPACFCGTTSGTQKPSGAGS